VDVYPQIYPSSRGVVNPRPRTQFANRLNCSTDCISLSPRIGIGDQGFHNFWKSFVTGLTRQRDGHNLATLLENADLFIARYSERLETAETAEFNSKHNALRTLVKQIQYIDPTSESFRYATDRKGKQTLATTQYLDLQDFAVQINDAISFLGFIASEFERQIDCREN
jgi:hypothetical protein